MIKFPTDYDVGELRGDQVAARECYVAMMEIDDHLQAMNIEEHRIAMESVEKLEEVLLDDLDHERTTKIGTLASPTICQELTAFLRSNRDVFAWTHEDMPGIDPSVLIHRLNVLPSFPPHSTEKASVRPGTRPSHCRRGPQTSGIELHKGGVLPRLARERGNG